MLKGAVHFILAILTVARIISGQCPNSLVVKHVLGKDESQVRFLLRAPDKVKPANAGFLLIILLWLNFF